MTDTPGKLHQYLTTLESALEALGPDETAEVVAEVRSLLAEAIADAGGDEDVALAGFGSPHTMAARILEERGVLAEQSRVPEAPQGLRALATGIDVLLWLAALVLAWAVIAVPVGVTAWSFATGRLVALALVGIIGVAALAGSAWWLGRARRQPGVITSGMAIVGLRRIRVGDSTRLVRTRDIVGAVSPSRLAPVVKTVLAVLLLTAVALSVSEGERGMDGQGRYAVVADASVGAAIVTEVYRGVFTGASEEQARGTFAEGAQGLHEDLVERHATGALHSYALLSIGLADYTTSSFDLATGGGDLVVLVETIEYDDADRSAMYRFTVRLAVEDLGGGASSGQWFIESVERID